MQLILMDVTPIARKSPPPSATDRREYQQTLMDGKPKPNSELVVRNWYNPNLTTSGLWCPRDRHDHHYWRDDRHFAVRRPRA